MARAAEVRRILITGATGFVGGWLAEDLARMMVDADCEALEQQLAGKVTRYSHEST